MPAFSLGRVATTILRPASVATSANVEGTFAVKRSVKRLSRASRFVSGHPSLGIEAIVSPQAFSSGNGGATSPGGQLQPEEDSPEVTGRMIKT